MNGITDVFVTVTVPKPEYEELVRDSEKLRIVTNYVSNSRYITHAELKMLLEVAENEIESTEKQEGQAVNE